MNTYSGIQHIQAFAVEINIQCIHTYVAIYCMNVRMYIHMYVCTFIKVLCLYVSTYVCIMEFP